MKILICCVLALPVLAACAGSHDNINDPDYQAGYDAGCTMAIAPPKAKRAAVQGQSDLYQRGFTSGALACDDRRSSGSRQ